MTRYAPRRLLHVEVQELVLAEHQAQIIARRDLYRLRRAKVYEVAYAQRHSLGQVADDAIHREAHIGRCETNTLLAIHHQHRTLQHRIARQRVER